MKKSIKVLLCTLVVGAVAVFGAGCSLTETLKQLTCKHDFGATATEVTQEATCTDEGTELWTCTLCGKEKTETIAKIDHVFDEGVIKKEATCTEAGEILYTCTMCETEKTELVEKTKHTRVDVDALPPTCTEDGYSDYAYCADCNTFLVPKTVLKATGHTSTVIRGYAATCTETGLTDGEECVKCGAVLTAQTEIAAKGHNVVTIEGRAATCTESGLTDGQACSTCGTVYVEQVEIPMLSHIDENADDRCDTCGLTKKATAREVDVTDGEKVAGNWYRIYRPAKPSIEGNFNTVEFQLSNAPVTTWDYSTDLKLMANSLGDNRMGYVYGPGPMGYTLDGMDSVITDEYIDIYLELGTYEIVGINNQGMDVIVEITEETTISLGDDGAYIKRLDMNYNWVTE